MHDRELLRLAAKAAAIEIVGLVSIMIVQPDHRAGGFVVRNDRGGDSCWNPITDDGDALRLAVKLGLDVCIDSPQEKKPHTHVIGFRNKHTTETIEAIEIHGDPYAATRRAIVRVAAKIGMEMNKPITPEQMDDWVNTTWNKCLEEADAHRIGTSDSDKGEYAIHQVRIFRERLAQEIEKMPFGDTAASFATFVRNFK